MQIQQAIYLSMTAGIILGTWFVRDRSSMVIGIYVLLGLLAMQAGWSPKEKHIASLTIWCFCLLLIYISTKPSILTLLFAILVPACYLPVVLFGADWRMWYEASDVAGILLLISLGVSGFLCLVGGSSPDRGFAHSGDLHSGMARALHSMGMAQADKRITSLEDI